MSLAIEHFRGIQHLTLALDGTSAAILGANGTGKSSVADALDFLLTGSVRRLTGEGAGGISLTRHGGHIDAHAEHAWVEAEFVSSDSSQSRVALRRCVAEPDKLIASGNIPVDVQQFLDLCRRGAHHLLTRRDILKYIITEPAQRLQQVASLLQLTRIDSVRKEIQGGARDAQDASKQSEAVRKSRLDSVFRSFNPPARNTADVLARANSHRALLGGAPLTQSEPVALREGITPPAAARSSSLQSQRTRELLETTEQWLLSTHLEVESLTDSYLGDVSDLHADTTALKSLRATDLISRGLDLISTSECPLCLREWDEGELRQLLLERLESAKDARRLLDGLAEQRRAIRGKISAVQSVVRSLASSLETELPSEAHQINEFSNALEFYAGQLLIDPVAGTLPNEETRKHAHDQLSPEGLLALVSSLRNKAHSLPDLRGVQQAWDELSGLDRAVIEFREARTAADLAKRCAFELGTLDKLFLEARNQVLQSTYDGIADRLTALYRRVHGEDEGAFEASISPTTAGLKLEVDFFGRGSYPPSALHSEGHQDSMGICLFLALTERLTDGQMPLLILDDVLMSVDHGHRRAVAELLRDEFSDVQFVITTHDRVWWRQLQSLGVVTRKTAFEIRQWSIEDGPILTEDAGQMLAEAERALAADDVPRAAHQLRRAVEVHFRDICDGLGAPVRFRGDGTFGAGDFVKGANKRIAELLKLAKQSAISWGRSTDTIESMDGARIAATQAFSQENWAVNPNVHYNDDWAHASAADFRAVLEAYKMLFGIYICSTCGSALWITEDGTTLTGLRCACGEISLNLTRRNSN